MVWMRIESGLGQKKNSFPREAINKIMYMQLDGKGWLAQIVGRFASVRGDEGDCLSHHDGMDGWLDGDEVCS